MPCQETNYWLTSASMPSGQDQSQLPASVDVAVIGAGFTGLSAARTLAQRGLHVAVLEANSIGWGASSRNGGMVLTGAKLSVETLISRYGLESARKIYDASIKSIECVERIIAQEKIDCNFFRCGHLEVACKPSHFAGYARSAELAAREFNQRLRIIPKNELGQEIGSRIYYGGLVDETSAGLNPARYVAGLARAASSTGAEIYEGTRVERLERSTRNGTPGFLLSASRGSIFANNVFVATSGYTSRTTPQFQKRIIPIGSYIIVTEQLPETLASELSPRNRMIYDSKHFLYYYRLTPDNRMLFGGRAAFFPETSSTIRRSAEILRRGMVSVYPQLQNTEVEFVWGGTLDFAFDTMPHAGMFDGLYYALGYAGHGVAMATFLGMKIANSICGDPDQNPFESLGFPTAPLGLYQGRPWFLPLAGAWYRFLDLVS
jgi:glycine/D-amino acid oxidase-like deaminating enzyme